MAHSLRRAEMLSEPIRVTLKVVKVFEQLEIPYLIGGSLASAVYGLIRATMDADLVAEVRPEHISALIASLKEEFYIDGEMILDAILYTIVIKIMIWTRLYDLGIGQMFCVDTHEMAYFIRLGRQDF
jgi:hypothetical protein